MTMEQHFYNIALRETPRIGSKKYRQLIDHFGSAEKVFEQEDLELKEIISNEQIRKDIHDKVSFDIAEKELKYCESQGIEILHYQDARFPQRLNFYDNTPGLLYFKGSADLNRHHMVSIVGTRKPSDRGRIITSKIVQDLKKHQPTIISGLALGIDHAAHKTAVEQKITTIGVVAHGLEQIYPAHHRKLAEQMQENGGVLTEFIHGTDMVPDLFPVRNRIVAAMTDAVIVVESAKSGGSLITANFGNEYNKDVFAVPGRPEDSASQGCNLLIKSHQAHMYESIKDLEYILRWNKKKNATQGSLFIELSSIEKEIVQYIRQQAEAHIDEIQSALQIPLSELAALILNLELNSIIKSIPGKRYICV